MQTRRQCKHYNFSYKNYILQWVIAKGCNFYLQKKYICIFTGIFMLSTLVLRLSSFFFLEEYTWLAPMSRNWISLLLVATSMKRLNFLIIYKKYSSKGFIFGKPFCNMCCMYICIYHVYFNILWNESYMHCLFVVCVQVTIDFS